MQNVISKKIFYTSIKTVEYGYTFIIFKQSIQLSQPIPQCLLTYALIYALTHKSINYSYYFFYQVMCLGCNV